MHSPYIIKTYCKNLETYLYKYITIIYCKNLLVKKTEEEYGTIPNNANDLFLPFTDLNLRNKV